MTIPEQPIYPRSGDQQTVYLKSVIQNPNITVGDYTMYHDFVHDPVQMCIRDSLYPAWFDGFDNPGVRNYPIQEKRH